MSHDAESFSSFMHRIDAFTLKNIKTYCMKPGELFFDTDIVNAFGRSRGAPADKLYVVNQWNVRAFVSADDGLVLRRQDLFFICVRSNGVHICVMQGGHEGNGDISRIDLVIPTRGTHSYVSKGPICRLTGGSCSQRESSLLLYLDDVIGSDFSQFQVYVPLCRIWQHVTELKHRVPRSKLTDFTVSIVQSHDGVLEMELKSTEENAIQVWVMRAPHGNWKPKDLGVCWGYLRMFHVTTSIPENRSALVGIGCNTQCASLALLNVPLARSDDILHLQDWGVVRTDHTTREMYNGVFTAITCEFGTRIKCEWRHVERA